MSETSGLSVSVVDLHRSYFKSGLEISVLRGANVEIAAGEQVVVVGPSGSGKSTFLHTLGTLERPTAGRILLGGRDVGELSEMELDALRNSSIGFVFQFHHLLPEQSALYNVAMPLLIRGCPRIEAKSEANRALDQVGLGERVSHLPGELSGGEQQRVAIARAMVTRPGLLLADEPTGNLDPKTASGVLDQFLALHQEMGSTLVIVTHSQALARRFPRKLEVVNGELQETT